MELRVISEGAGWRVCDHCPDEATVTLSDYDDPARHSAFCLGCLILRLLQLRERLSSTRREPAAAVAGSPPGS